MPVLIKDVTFIAGSNNGRVCVHKTLASVHNTPAAGCTRRQVHPAAGGENMAQSIFYYGSEPTQQCTLPGSSSC